MTPRASIVVATYNRPEALARLLDDLANQTLPADAYEVVVVDDGSTPPAEPAVAARSRPYPLQHVAQANAGQAAARHRGIELAQAPVVVILDDDMRVGPDFVASHLKAHEAGYDVVQGTILLAEGDLALHERWHARYLRRLAEEVGVGQTVLRGGHLATGNVSFGRALYFEVGGFDTSLLRSEDRELGIRFEKAGARLGLSADARSIHHSDHDSVERWLDRSYDYGVFDLRIARKHADHEDADPWRFLFEIHPLSRALVTLTTVAPGAGKRIARLGWRVSDVLDRLGAESVALAGTNAVYGIEYFRGMRAEAGSLAASARDLGGYLVKRGRERLSRGHPSPLGAAANLLHSVGADFRAMQSGRNKYLGEDIQDGALPLEAVRRIGLQMLVAVRLMRFLRDAGVPLGPQVASRLIRHLYGAEIHWDAEVAPGISILHGNGLVVSHSATVGEGCVLMHNVTLGEAVDPETRVMRAPILERDVHVGPGAVLLGPITVGEGTKVMAGAVLARSVPPRSLVRPPAANVGSRASGGRPRAPRSPRATGGNGALPGAEPLPRPRPADPS